MSILSLRFDHAGRPVVELYIGVSAAETEFRPAAPPVLVRALVDTGASKTNVASWVLDRLGLSPIGQVLVHTASTGSTPLLGNVYAVDLALAGAKTGLLATDLDIVAAEDLSGSGVDALLGRDVLRRGLFVYDGPEERFTLATETPERSHP
ncbi:MAG: aspartyl protease family protein [Isosphaeraceae bacterium]